MSNKKTAPTVADLLALIGARHTDTLLGAYRWTARMSEAADCLFHSAPTLLSGRLA